MLNLCHITVKVKVKVLHHQFQIKLTEQSWFQARGYRLCIHELDFNVGATIAANVDQAIHQSKRTLCVVSRNFIRSPICMSEFDTARSFDLAYNKNRLIMVNFDDMEEEEMPEQIQQYIRIYTYLKRDSPLFMTRLIYMLAQGKMGQEDQIEMGEQGDDVPLII